MSISGADSTEIKIRGLGERLKRDIVEAISEAGREAETALRAGAPVGETGRLSRSVNLGGVSFHPGGLGGGGFYELELNVGEGVPYLQHVVEGTGIHVGHGNITPREKSVMHWTGAKRWGDPRKAAKGIRGDKHFATETEGQEPNDKWIRGAQAVANEVMERKIREIDARHDT